jgi:hypothetical protein
MERSKELEGNPNDGKILWKKVGGGSFALGGRLIKPGQIFRAKLEEIPKGFRDVVVAQEEIQQEMPIEEKPIVPVNPVYKIVPRGRSTSLFNVVDADDKPLNDKGLTKEIAEKLVSDLEK